ncbi:hypothetical protein CCM_09269 [Cordyceps militaris CM01]|uniref:Secreted protein n=1 Tax=Cordyceps militaris (strain CM01) TaxID=983644 RepID=G3JTX9_CORMM|nr:uncharacterized protein CCM_09269 [Cordyceps militaris CM01]EGX88133.1 hypothetical protein CCM_09269 [Cordyceps militaris CM01]
MSAGALLLLATEPLARADVLAAATTTIRTRSREMRNFVSVSNVVDDQARARLFWGSLKVELCCFGVRIRR